MVLLMQNTFFCAVSEQEKVIPGEKRKPNQNTSALSKSTFMFFLMLPGKIVCQVLAEERGAEVYLCTGGEAGCTIPTGLGSQKLFPSTLGKHHPNFQIRWAEKDHRRSWTHPFLPCPWVSAAQCAFLLEIGKFSSQRGGETACHPFACLLHC